MWTFDVHKLWVLCLWFEHESHGSIWCDTDIFAWCTLVCMCFEDLFVLEYDDDASRLCDIDISNYESWS